MEDAMNGLPGVKGSGLALYNPLTNNWGEVILVSGHPAPKVSMEAGASWDRVSSNYLQNLGMTAVRGRNFTIADNGTAAPVAIVNQAFVKKFFKSGEIRSDSISASICRTTPLPSALSASCGTRSLRVLLYEGRLGRCFMCR